MGDWEKAVELCDVAMRLTGMNKPFYPTVKAASLFVGQRYAEAAAISAGVLEYQPANLEALAVLAASQAEMGLERRARATAELIKERLPSADLAVWLDNSPYQDPETRNRWREALTMAGAIA